MATLPQLLEEDIQQLDDGLRVLLEKTDATTALLIDQGGFLLTSQGDSRHFDLTTIAALASGAYMATQTIAGLVHETNFNSIYQQGEQYSLYAQRVDDYCILVVIFKAQVSVGLVKYYAAPAVEFIARQMTIAQERDPAATLDLSAINVADTRDLFKRRDGS
ncbi:MAG TPA: roadblock/LC7 domain-containing protein [Verrucomicrobiota bacterium]|nr:roadblock/LC7 domain-containing protein [Verrucomicrobiota bacterium]HRT08673.1 roadblock/LC7 domain-containing protein [Candidatus Paceibacterota bacterium]HRT57245.1 roadblock/LC7 domain-containing protein [Candidatus Paceibacterota bacterium]